MYVLERNATQKEPIARWALSFFILSNSTWKGRRASVRPVLNIECGFVVTHDAFRLRSIHDCGSAKVRIYPEDFPFARICANSTVGWTGLARISKS